MGILRNVIDNTRHLIRGIEQKKLLEKEGELDFERPFELSNEDLSKLPSDTIMYHPDTGNKTVGDILGNPCYKYYIWSYAE